VAFSCFRNAFAFLAAATSLTRGRKNSCWHGELVGPGFCRALVSEEDGGERAARLVLAAFRVGRGKLDVLFRAGTENGGALVRCDAELFHVLCKVTSIVFVSFDTGEIVAAGFAKARRNGRQRQSEIDTGLAGSAAQKFSARNINPTRCGKTWRFTPATFACVFSAETSIKRARAVDRNAERARSCY